MDSMAVVWVLPGQSLLLDNTTVEAACGTMWNGIYVDSTTTGVAVKNGSRIQDGLHGLTAFGEAVLEINNSEFVNNLAGIRILGDGRPSGLMLLNTSFSSDSMQMLPPYANQLGHSGIYLEEVDGVEIGAGGNGLDCSFSHLANGIYAFHSDVEVMNCDFDHIQDQVGGTVYDVARGSGIFSEGYVGTNPVAGFRLQSGGNHPSLANTFHDLPWGIHVVGNHDVRVERNVFQNVSSHGLMVEQCYADSITVLHNTLTNVVRGIRCALNTRSEILIDQNTVNNALTYAGEAIKVQDMNVLGIPVPGHTKIQRNNLDTYGYGIVGDGVGKMRIDQNTVYIRGEDPSHGYGVGINLGASDSCHVLDNNVRFVQDPNAPVTANADLVGIWVYQSNLSSVSCNRTYNFHDHNRVTDTDTMQIFKNWYYDGLVSTTVPQRGIVLKDGSNIGQQGGPGFPTGNRWYRVDPGTGFYTESWDCNPIGTRAMVMTENTVLNNLFERYYPIADPVQDPNDPQQAFCNGNSGGSGFFITTTKGNIPTTCAEFNWGSGEPGEAGLERIAEVVETNPDAVEAFQAGQSLLSLMQLDSSHCDHSTHLATCFHQLAEGGQGEVYAVDGALLDGESPIPGTSHGLALLGNHQQLESSWRSLSLGLGYSLQDSLALHTLAQGCPLREGKAVHQARSLMAVIAPTNVYTDQACESLSIGKSHSSGAEVEEDNKLVIIPNPARNLVTLMSPIPSVKVKVTDLSGKVVTTFDIEEHNSSLEVESWPRGVYLFQATYPDGKTEVTKVVLQ